MAFNERKVAQMAAFFLQRNGGSLSILKLMKLLYLADRRALDMFDTPISGDRMVSMPHGPVLSKTYELMNGSGFSVENGWDSWVADRAGHMLSLKQSELSQSDLDLPALSEADIEVLAAVQDEFGAMDAWALRNFTHDHCAEWRDPDGSSLPIDYKDVFTALGRAPEEAHLAQQNLDSHNSMDQLFSRIRCS
ncbi:Panacea domain-containing protein [Pseudomonas sp. BF-R-24]|uniref:Panacea domain-containing protein n=1 Tax=Pseudomonas sp. BF-R-24 TaxID=2832386 RepID=UPI001CC09EBF|nr:Panacea domain-containing protein [Pseudomonas sp. BF-R-24]